MFSLPSSLTAVLAVAAITISVVWHVMKPGRSHLLLSPLLALGGTALLFYVVIPTAVLPFVNALTRFQFYVDRAHAFDGSAGQTLIWAFGILCLGLHHLAAGALKPNHTATTGLPFAATAIVTVLLTLALGWGGWSARQGHALLSGDMVAWGGTLLTFIGTLALISARGARQLAVAVLLVALIVASLYLAGSGKRVAFTTLGLTLAFIVTRRIKAWAIGLLVCIGMVVAAFGVTRSLHRHAENPFSELGLVFEHKVWGRQVETGLCFNNVVSKRWTDDLGRPPYYFVTGLVPRAIWPEKPSLSLGNQHALEYCDPTASPLHSASITLLGEPLENAGLIGLAVMMVVVIGLGWGAIRLASSRHGEVVAVAVALYPWLLDFDQDFAMYLANTAKFTLPLWPAAGLLFKITPKRQ